MELILGIVILLLGLIIGIVIEYKKEPEVLTGRWYRQRTGFNAGIIVEYKLGKKTLTRKATIDDINTLKTKFNMRTIES